MYLLLFYRLDLALDFTHLLVVLERNGKRTRSVQHKQQRGHRDDESPILPSPQHVSRTHAKLISTHACVP
jgi:hypothetical protein